MDISDKIGSKENLGRGVFSSKDGKRAARGKVPSNIFLEKKGETEISVDRLDYAPESVAVEIGDKVAELRNRSFYGWAVVSAEVAGSNGRKVLASPKPEYNNPYHADIIMPDSVTEDLEEQLQHAQELADNSVWRARPECP